MIRKGVVNGIPPEYSVEELLEAAESNVEIKEITRINRRVRNQEDNSFYWVPSRAIIVTFVGQTLPPDMSFFKIKSKVRPYIAKLKQCYKCYRFGHVSSSYRGKEKCKMCGVYREEHGPECMNTVPRCANCRGSHIPTSSECPLVIKNLEVLKIMAQENVS